MDNKCVQILEGLNKQKLIEATARKNNNKAVVNKCKLLLKMLDTDVDVTVKNKLKQIIMFADSEDLKTDLGSLDDAVENLDLFLKVIAKLEV